LAAYGVFRHGARYPQAKDIKKLSAIRRRLQLAAELPPPLRWLSSWDPAADYPLDREGQLHDVGRDELSHIARRLQGEFPALFPPSIEPAPAHYDFGATAKPRTQQSARAFASGLVGGAEADVLGEIQHAPLDADPLLRFHKACPRYQASIKDNDTLVDIQAGGVTVLRR
jgi:hypothetical protein